MEMLFGTLSVSIDDPLASTEGGTYILQSSRHRLLLLSRSRAVTEYHRLLWID